jgi:50S ribosomal subunit-associated GTPase HflX
MFETRPKKNHERALLIGLEKQGVSKWDLQDSLEELAELATSAGAEVVDTVTQKLQKPTAPYYIGKGKAEEIKHSFQDREVTSVIFDDELSPAQGRNLENLLASPDRAGAIAISAAAIDANVGSLVAPDWRHRHARPG